MLGFIVTYIIPTVFVTALISGSLYLLRVMQTELLSPTSGFWGRLVCAVGIIMIVFVYTLIAKTLFKYRVWLP